MAVQLFEVIVIEHPVKKAADEGEEPRIIFGPQTISAASERAALVQAGALIASEVEGFKATRLEVRVRNFA